MKTFNTYFGEANYPDSFKRNRKLMALVNKYDDPLKFVLAVMTAMSSGRLKLPKIGVASTREVAALWNDHKNKKIAPAMVEQWMNEDVLDYLEESRSIFVKGWTKKDKIISATGEFNIYHIKQVVLFPRKFGLTEKKLLKILEDWFDDMSAPDPELEAKKQLSELESGGVVDNSPPIEEYLFKKGYCRFVIDKTHGSVEGQTEKECREGAKILDHDYLPYENDGFKLFEIKPVRGRPTYITNKLDWNDFVEGKAKRKHVSKMAQFREYLEELWISPNKGAKYGQVIFLVGGAAAGKSTAIRKFIDDTSYKVLNPDDVKALIAKAGKRGFPAFSDLKDVDPNTPKGSQKLHQFILKTKLSSKKSRMMTDPKTARNPDTLPNLIYDRTFSFAGEFKKISQGLIKAGYKANNIHVVYVMTDIEIALDRNRNRERTLPDEVIRQSNQGAMERFAELYFGRAKGAVSNGDWYIIFNRGEGVMQVKSQGKRPDKSGKVGLKVAKTLGLKI